MMTDLSSIQSVGRATKSAALSSKPEVSMTSVSEATAANKADLTKALEQIKVELKEAEYAYSLMMEIKQRLHQAYNATNQL